MITILAPVLLAIVSLALIISEGLGTTTQTDTTTVVVGQVIQGSIESLEQIDAYVFDGTQGDVITIRAKPTGTYFDTRLELYAPGDSVIATALASGHYNRSDMASLKDVGNRSTTGVAPSAAHPRWMSDLRGVFIAERDSDGPSHVVTANRRRFLDGRYDISVGYDSRSGLWAEVDANWYLSKGASLSVSSRSLTANDPEILYGFDAKGKGSIEVIPGTGLMGSVGVVPSASLNYEVLLVSIGLVKVTGFVTPYVRTRSEIVNTRIAPGDATYKETLQADSTRTSGGISASLQRDLSIPKLPYPVRVAGTGGASWSSRTTNRRLISSYGGQDSFSHASRPQLSWSLGFLIPIGRGFGVVIGGGFQPHPGYGGNAGITYSTKYEAIDMKRNRR